MAGASDKKRLEENAAHLRRLQITIVVSNVSHRAHCRGPPCVTPDTALELHSAFVPQLIHIAVRLLWRRATWGAGNTAGLVLTTVIYALCYKMISVALGAPPTPISAAASGQAARRQWPAAWARAQLDPLQRLLM